MEGGKSEVSESGTARSSQCVCAQASAQGGTKRPLYYQTHTHTHTPYVAPLTIDSASLIVKFPLQGLSLSVAHILANSHSPVLSFPLCFSVDRLPAWLHLSSFPLCLPLWCLLPHFWLHYSWRFIVPNGQSTADTEGFISLGTCVMRCEVCLWGLYMHV